MVLFSSSQNSFSFKNISIFFCETKIVSFALLSNDLTLQSKHISFKRWDNYYNQPKGPKKIKLKT